MAKLIKKVKLPRLIGVPNGLKPAVRLYRNPKDPYESHLLPDFELPPGQILDLKKSSKMVEIFKHLPLSDLLDKCDPKWNSVALFFNLTTTNRPEEYKNTTVSDALNWLDEGTDPASPTISSFLCHYWRTLSYGQLSFGINTPRGTDGKPLIPTLSASAENPDDWETLINLCLDANAELIWKAAGSLMKDNKRWVPSVVLVQNSKTHASARFGSYDRTVGGKKYLIGDKTHIKFNLDFVDLPGVPQKKVRKFWGTLCHEFGHNLLEFWDLYGPQGCTGYWDLLGDNTPPGRMSEVCSVLKNRIGWLNFKLIILGPSFAARNLELKPYTTSGEAFKIIPDPKHNPHEYFILEYRKSTGKETWRPDGALVEEGLLIIHINERLGVSGVWLMRDAPFFDPEFADFSDNGVAQWTGHGQLNGILFPQVTKNSFTRTTSPNSNFYGDRPSGLSITQIRVEAGKCKFRLQIQGETKVAWKLSAKNRCLAGHFTPDSVLKGKEIFIRNDNNVALVAHKQAQWFAVNKQNDWIGNWNLGKDNYELVGDFDGDGRDEIYVRSPDWAGVLKWQLNKFISITVQNDWIGNWNLGKDNYELVGDFDGDLQDEIYIRSPNWAGIMKLDSNRLKMQSIQEDWIDQWNLGKDNSEFIGRFTQSTKDEILLRSPIWMGLLFWDLNRKKLRLKKIQKDKIDGWILASSDKHVVGDFDGDGLDEIYIRSAKKAGIIKWVSGKFKLIWMRENEILPIDAKKHAKIILTSLDLSYCGLFLPTREGILHRNSSGLSVLTWENNQMMIRHHLPTPLDSRWNLTNDDKFVLADFHRIGRDIGNPELDYIEDHLTDVFIYSDWGTAMVGVNHALWNPDKPDDIRQEIGLTWINQKEILFDT